MNKITALLIILFFFFLMSEASKPVNLNPSVSTTQNALASNK